MCSPHRMEGVGMTLYNALSWIYISKITRSVKHNGEKRMRKGSLKIPLQLSLRHALSDGTTVLTFNDIGHAWCTKLSFKLPYNELLN